jgi:hypothetical protein
MVLKKSCYECSTIRKINFSFSKEDTRQGMFVELRYSKFANENKERKMLFNNFIIYSPNYESALKNRRNR